MSWHSDGALTTETPDLATGHPRCNHQQQIVRVKLTSDHARAELSESEPEVWSSQKCLNLKIKHENFTIKVAFFTVTDDWWCHVNYQQSSKSPWNVWKYAYCFVIIFISQWRSIEGLSLTRTCLGRNYSYTFLLIFLNKWLTKKEI